MNRRMFAAVLGSGVVIEAAPNPIEAARLSIAQSLRTQLTHLNRYCRHAECWDLALQNIRDGANHITYGPCCHDYTHNRTYYRVVAEWLVLGEYGVDGSRQNPMVRGRKQG